jgi:hypothetical protein
MPTHSPRPPPALIPPQPPKNNPLNTYEKPSDTPIEIPVKKKYAAKRRSSNYFREEAGTPEPSMSKSASKG